MNLQTVVYDEDLPYAKATIGDLANGNCIISCCQGDAMAERDELEKGQEAYNAVITYMLGKGSMQEPMEFLRLWNEGDFDSLREEWPDAPPEIYYADPLSK